MIRSNEMTTRLGAVPLFGRCSRSDLRIVARHGERLEVPAGTTLVAQGEKGDTFFLLLQGEATVTRDGTPAGRMTAGDSFGELALLDPAPRAATVVATTDAEVLVLNTRMFKVLLRELPGLSAALLAMLARRARSGEWGHGFDVAQAPGPDEGRLRP